MARLEWSPHMSLGIAAIDEAHRVMLSRLGRFEGCGRGDYDGRLQDLIGGLEQAFGREEALMEAICFPGQARHREQHVRMVCLLRVAHAALARDDQPARDAVALLPHLFLLHLSSMDTELAVALDLVATTQNPP